MDARDLDLHGALRESAGNPVLTNREVLLDAIMLGIASGGTDVADAPELPPSLQAVPRAPSRIAPRVIGAGVIGWSVLALGSAAAATGLWYSLSVANPPAPPAMPSPAISSLAPEQEAMSPPLPSIPAEPSVPAEPVTSALPAIVEAEPASSTAGHQPADPPSAAGRDASAPAAATAPDARDGNDQPDPGLTAQLEDVTAEALDTVNAVVTDTVSPVIGAVNVSTITGDLTNLLTCALTIPVSVDVTDDMEVASVTAHLSSATLTGASTELTDAGDGSWSGSLTTNVVGSLLAKVLDTQISVQAVDAYGNATSRSVTVNASLLACN